MAMRLLKAHSKLVSCLVLASVFISGGLSVALGATQQESWVEVEGIVAFGQDTTLESAQRGSLDAARRAAIEQAVGTFVMGSTVVKNFQLADDLVHAVVRGVIVEEKILGRGISGDTGSDGALYKTRLRAKVKGIPVERRGNFTVAMKMSRPVYNDGEETTINIIASQDACLYLFNVTQDEHITVLAPNRIEAETRLQAGKEYLFPSEALLKQHIKLRTWLLPGVHKSAEKIKAIVTRNPVSLLKGEVAEGVFKEYDPSKTALLLDLMRVLATLDPADWAEATAEYEVRKQ